MKCQIPAAPAASLAPCPDQRLLPQYVESLDAMDVIEQEAWLDEKNANITFNAQLYRECAIAHEVLAMYIRNLPDC